MGSELGNARQGLAHIHQAILECRAGARLIDVDDGMACLDDEPAVDEVESVENAEGSALRRLRVLETLAADWVKACEKQAMNRIPLTEGMADGKQ